MEKSFASHINRLLVFLARNSMVLDSIDIRIAGMQFNFQIYLITLRRPIVFHKRLEIDFPYMYYTEHVKKQDGPKKASSVLVFHLLNTFTDTCTIY